MNQPMIDGMDGGVPMNSSKTDLAATFLREQRDLLQELIEDVENRFMSRNAALQRIAKIEENIRTLKNLI